MLKHRRLGKIKRSGGYLTGNARIGGVGRGDSTLGDVLLGVQYFKPKWI